MSQDSEMIKNSYINMTIFLAAMTYNGLVHVCASTTVSPVMFAAPIVPASYELVLTILTTIRAYQYAPGIKALEGTSLVRAIVKSSLIVLTHTKLDHIIVSGWIGVFFGKSPF